MKRVEKISEYLKYEFAETEKTENAQVLARKTRSLQEFGLKKKQLGADLKKEEETLNSEIATSARYVTDGYDFRMIECVVKYDDPRDGMKTIYRTDTGESVRVERMQDAEKQRDLPFVEEKKVQKPESFELCPVCGINVPMFDGNYGDHGIVSGSTGLKDLCAGSKQAFVVPVNGVPAVDTTTAPQAAE